MNDGDSPPGHKKTYKRMQCINCGCLGHAARKCNEPITSCGIICYRRNPVSSQLQYLLIQKRNSLNYVEFVRGKYDIVNKEYLLKLISHITHEERDILRNNDFDAIWRLLWVNEMPPSKRFMNNYHDSKRKFEKLKKGFNLKDVDGTILFFSIDYLLNSATARFSDTEWEFPKGRRQVNERDLDCALREFQEEAGIPMSSLNVQDMKPVDEVFVGNNKVRYRHVYYIASIASQSPHIGFLDLTNMKQCGEVKNIGWFDVGEAVCKMRDMYVERKELIIRVNRLLHATPMAL